MPVAFVLINAEVGAEGEVLKKLRDLPDIKEAYAVFGIYDIVAKVEAASMNRLKEIVDRNVRRIDKVQSTLTMIAMEGEQKK